MKNFEFSGRDTVELAEKYGTPLYVFSQDIFHEKAKSLKDAFEAADCDYEINFAGKSFLNQAAVKMTEAEGLSLDCASGGELYTALSVGFPPERITLHGSNKSEAELLMALENGIGRIVVDSEDELRRIEKLCDEGGYHANILFRINPGVDAHTNELINTGKTDTKFGLPLDVAIDIIKQVKDIDAVDLIGLHCHVGSQVTDESCFVEASKIMADLYVKCAEEGFDLKELNLGGGFGIAYRPGDASFDPVVYIPKMVVRIREIFEKKGLVTPKIMIEPGRFLSAEAGITLYTVGTVKEIEGLRTYVSVDGGMTDNPRPALYDALYDAVICNRELTPENGRSVRVSGKACESDTLIKEVTLADPQVGDTLAVRHTGAYNYSMASHYNRLPNPAVVLLSQGRDAEIVKRETYEDLVKNDQVPDWL